MARRGGGRGGRSSSGRSSGGRSSSSSRGRSSSRSSSSRSSSSSSSSKSSSGRSSSKGRATKSNTSRTRTTKSAPARKASKPTSKAKPKRVTRTVVKRKTVSPPPRSAPKPAFASGAISVKKKTPAQKTAALMSGAGTPVTVTYASGQKQTMKLSIAAIRYYQNQGLKVSPVQKTFGGINPMQQVFSFGQPNQMGLPTPNIPRIIDQSPPWTENPPKQLHVTQQIKKAVKPKRISAFGGLGANPWNPVELLGGDIRGLFGAPTTQNPKYQYLPQQQNTQSTGYPTYTAMAQGQYQEQAYAESQRGFQTSMLGDSSFQPMDTIKNLASNQWVIIGGLAFVVLIVIKFLLGGRGGGSRGGGGTKIYT